ncbi:MAG: type II toxin-antitoxin system VapB family antitoxin [Rhizomicrobium sp.]|jgi:hypothetical protein
MSALNIKDAEVAKKARRLAKLKRTTITAAVSQALDESLRVAQCQTAAAHDARERVVDEIVKRFRAGLKHATKKPSQIIAEMYDENGLPR